mmetsp:Transcript_10717/g.26901  ORF Transcript_10717/g.26901 Transcript_10717/m.26901 type:complete len:158 (+) Transcript_10717:375-848(+)
MPLPYSVAFEPQVGQPKLGPQSSFFCAEQIDLNQDIQANAQENMRPSPHSFQSAHSRRQGNFKCDLLLHQCPICPIALKYKKNLGNHIRVVHEGIKDYSCEECGHKFSTRSNKLKCKHTMQQSNEIVKAKKHFRCLECPRTFESKAALVDHSVFYHV